MAITFDKLEKSLKDRKFYPVYFLHGEEAYFIDYISDYLEANVLTEAEKGFNQQVMYGKDSSIENIINAARRYPMMSNLQLIIVKEAQYLNKLEMLESYMAKPVPSTVLVICHKYKKLDSRLKIAKVMDTNPDIAFFESKKLDEKKVPEWINARIKEQNRTIKPQACQLLTEYLGNDLEKLTGALDKLILTKESGSPIDEKDIETHIGISREYNAWELQKALGNKDIKKVGRIMHFAGTHPKEMPFPLVLGAFYNYFSKLTALQANPANAAALKVNEWQMKDFQPAIGNFKGKSMQVMQVLQEFDLRFKGVNASNTDEAELLKEMVYRILYL